MRLVLDIDFATVCIESRSLRLSAQTLLFDDFVSQVENNLEVFCMSLHEDICQALGTNSQSVSIRNVEAGSVVVTLGLLPSDDGRSSSVFLSNVHQYVKCPLPYCPLRSSASSVLLADARHTCIVMGH